MMLLPPRLLPLRGMLVLWPVRSAIHDGSESVGALQHASNVARLEVEHDHRDGVLLAQGEGGLIQNL